MPPERLAARLIASLDRAEPPDAEQHRSGLAVGIEDDGHEIAGARSSEHRGIGGTEPMPGSPMG